MAARLVTEQQRLLLAPAFTSGPTTQGEHVTPRYAMRTRPHLTTDWTMCRNYGEPLGEGPQTNQRAELTGILKALQIVPVTQNLLIETDSMYAIMCVTEWHKQ
jgi:hypothetical protein